MREWVRRVWVIGAVCVFVVGLGVGIYVDNEIFSTIGCCGMLLILYLGQRYKERKAPRDWATGIWADEIVETEDSVRQEAEAAEAELRLWKSNMPVTKRLTLEEAIAEEAKLPEIWTDKEIDEWVDRIARGEEEIEDGRDRIKTEIREAQPDLADEEIETILALTIDAPARVLGMTPDEFVNSLHYHKENHP